MSRLAPFLLLLVVPASVPAYAQAQTSSSQAIVVWGLAEMGIEGAGPASSLTTQIEAEIAKMGGYGVMPRAAARAKAAAFKPALSSCEGETSCLAEVGRAVGADVVIYGNLALFGDTWTVNLRSVDPKRDAEINAVSETLTGDVTAMSRAMILLAYRLLAPDRATGELALVSERDGASVSLDGVLIGKTPLAPQRVPAGVHAVRVEADGYIPFEIAVNVAFRDRTQVKVKFEPAPVKTAMAALLPATAAPRPGVEVQPVADAPAATGSWFGRHGKTLSFSLGGAGLLGAGAFTYFLIKTKQTHDQHNLACPGGSCPTDSAYSQGLHLKTQGEREQLYAGISLGVTALLLATSVTTFTFDEMKWFTK